LLFLVSALTLSKSQKKNREEKEEHFGKYEKVAAVS
jgi:hypothetical protein